MRSSLAFVLLITACGGGSHPSDEMYDLSGVAPDLSLSAYDGSFDSNAPADDLRLSSLVVSQGTLSPAFSPALTFYNLDVGATFGGAFTLTPTAMSTSATITVDGASVASGAASAPYMPVVANIDIVVTNGDGTAQYTVRVIPQTGQEAYVKASNTAAGAHFGQAVALSPDGNTLVVGSPAESSDATGVGGNQKDTSAPGAGAVYVFTRTATAWHQTAYLKASNTDAGDAFGSSVAISSDGETIIVGAPNEASDATGIGGSQSDNTDNGAGAVYVFQHTGAVWLQQAYIKASNTQVTAGFGTSLSLSGESLLVGAPGESCSTEGVNGTQCSSGEPASGAAYLFTRSGATWTQEAYIKSSYTVGGYAFGSSVALNGSFFVVGAPGEASDATGTEDSADQTDVSMPLAGAVYAFYFDTATSAWEEFAYIKASNTQAGQQFGAQLAFDGTHMAVGAIGEASKATGVGGDQTDTSLVGAGAVYAFLLDLTSGQWSQEAYIKASNTRANASFGSALALAGDTLVVGSPGESSNAIGLGGNQLSTVDPNAGAAYLFSRAGIAWSQTKYVKASNTRGGAFFGSSAALCIDTLAVGSYEESSDATGVGGSQIDSSDDGAGAVYVFR